MINLFVIFIIAILLAFYNGYFIIYSKETDTIKKKKYSDIWHSLGWFIRALFVIILYPNWLNILIYTNIAWTLYDIIIALIMKQKWYYQGNTSIMERNIPNWVIYTGKIIILTLTIILWAKKTYFWIF